MAKNCIEIEGLITRAEGSGNFRVELQNGHEILCTTSGKLKQNFIKLIPGDKVRVEISPYDLNRGRISRRLNDRKELAHTVYHKKPK
jgi:translation initiation factor IF-1